MKKYICAGCGYIYDPAKGDNKQNVEEGTSFETLHSDWLCPLCGISKSGFRVW